MPTTTRLDPIPHVHVRTLAVEVVEGPDKGKRVEAETELLTVGTARGNVLEVSDETVSGYHLELDCTKQCVVVRDLGSTNGTSVGDVRIMHGRVPIGTVLALGETKLRLVDGEQSLVALHGSVSLQGLVGQSQGMRRIMAQIERAAASPTAVLISGESGTGKELVARALHELSPRAKGPFVTVDCGALTPTLVASELFGHERAAFTGAERQHQGAFERADGGTLFLDEIGELPAELQPQLLGALERGRFRRLGGEKELTVDVRVVCATNRDLRAEVNAGTFRMDLYYRIAVVELRQLPLRERTEDIPLLIDHFLRECGADSESGTMVPSELMSALLTHRWPGNVRELRNWVEATVAMGESPELAGGLAQPGGVVEVSDGMLELSYKEARSAVLEQFEARYLSHLLESTGGNVTQASKKARMDRSYLIKLLQRHQLR